MGSTKRAPAVTRAKVKKKGADKSPVEEGKRAYVLRRSGIHGKGAFAKTPIPKGALVDEYTGERISHKEADRRYAGKQATSSHTFLFTLDERFVLDATRGGNASRFINHSCAPNCESVVKAGHIFIRAIRAIRAGEELSYDYGIERDPDDPPEVALLFACRCGAKRCRGTMFAPVRRKKRSTTRRRPAIRTAPSAA